MGVPLGPEGVAVNRLNFPPGVDQATDKFHLYFALVLLQLTTQRLSEYPKGSSLSLMYHYTLDTYWV